VVENGWRGQPELSVFKDPLEVVVGHGEPV
jgi:hypothetical protein